MIACGGGVCQPRNFAVTESNTADHTEFIEYRADPWLQCRSIPVVCLLITFGQWYEPSGAEGRQAFVKVNGCLYINTIIGG